jgi:hypothetical protein
MTTSVFPEGWQRVQKYTYNYIAVRAKEVKILKTEDVSGMNRGEERSPGHS